jgi:hypothetical protein
MTKINAEGLAWGESKRAMPAGMVEFCERGFFFLSEPFNGIFQLKKVN